MIPVVLRCDRGSDHIVREYSHDHDDADGCPAWCFDVFSTLIDKPQSRLIAAAILDEDEYRRDHRNRRTKHVKQYLSGPDPGGLAPQFPWQEPVDRPHEPHQKPD